MTLFLMSKSKKFMKFPSVRVPFHAENTRVHPSDAVKIKSIRFTTASLTGVGEDHLAERSHSTRWLLTGLPLKDKRRTPLRSWFSARASAEPHGRTVRGFRLWRKGCR